MQVALIVDKGSQIVQFLLGLALGLHTLLGFAICPEKYPDLGEDCSGLKTLFLDNTRQIKLILMPKVNSDPKRTPP